MFLRNIKINLSLILLSLFVIVRLFVICKGDFTSCPEFDIVSPSFLLLERIRQGAIRKTQENLPSPVSELLLGMTIGVDHFGKLPKFKNMLLKTGTIHVVVVSGYNISLVYSMVNIFLGSFYDKSKLILGIIVAFFYSLISGFDPPVIRSWIMGTIAYLGKYYGRSFPTLRVLFVSALFMLVWKPLFLFSLSFQLSFMATLSLILFSDWVKSLSFVSKIPLLFREDFIATFAAQILVWPLISIYFGRVSLISILVNTLVLWTVPLATVLGGVFLLTSFLGNFLFISRILAFFVYIPMNFFTNIIVFFSSFKFAEIDFSFSIVGFCAYYLIITLLFRKVIFTNANVK